MNRAICYAPPYLLRYLSGSAATSLACRLTLTARQADPFGYVAWTRYLLLFAVTLVLEAPAYVAVLQTRRLPLAARARALVAANLATHPVVCFVIPFLVFLAAGSVATSTAAGELFAPAVEAMLLWRVWRVPPLAAVLGSVAANLMSWWLGVVLIPGL